MGRAACRFVTRLAVRCCSPVLTDSELMEIAFFPVPGHGSPKFVFITKSHNKTKMKTRRNRETTATARARHRGPATVSASTRPSPRGAAAREASSRAGHGARARNRHEGVSAFGRSYCPLPFGVHFGGAPDLRGRIDHPSGAISASRPGHTAGLWLLIRPPHAPGRSASVSLTKEGNLHL